MSENHDSLELMGKIGTSLPPGLKIIGRYEVGEYGAYDVLDSEGNHLVLKQSPDPLWYQQLERAKEVTDELRLLGSPVSEYVYISHDQDGSYWLQKKIAGIAMTEDPSLDQLKRLIALIEMQADKSTPKEQNWSRYVKGVVFDDESGWLHAIKSCSSRGAELISKVSRLVAGLDSVDLPVTDIVHGDFSTQQVLVKDGRITGIVDWDAVGCGDRGIDLASLLYDAYRDPKLEEPLRVQLLKVSGKSAARIYLIYRMLAVIAWQVQQKSNESAIKGGFGILEYIEETF